MPGLRIMCPICTEDFKESDEIYSTNCGHIYHLPCISEWQRRSTTCSQCRSHNPTTHKLFLILNDGSEESANSPSAPTSNTSEDQDLQAKLESSAILINDQYAQLQEAELNFYHLQEQFTVEQELRKKLEYTVAQSNDNETNFLHLHAQYSESEDRAKILHEENERLNLENEFKAKEIRRLAEIINFEKTKCSECEKLLLLHQEENKRLIIESEQKLKELSLKEKEIDALKEFQYENRNGADNSFLELKISILENKLKHICGELEKEISKSTQKAIENIRLQNHIRQLELHPNAERQEATTLTEHQPTVKTENISNASADTPSSSTHQIKKLDGYANSVIILKFPYNQIHYPLEKVIVSLAAKMDVSLTNKDVVKAKILDRNIEKNIPKTVSVLVQFKTEDFKSVFISKRFLLKKDTIFGCVTIKAYYDPKIYSVFIYASKKLREIGFDHITCTDDRVVARNRHSRDELIISTKDQVDELFNKQIEVLPIISPPPAKEPAIDECYYQI